LLFDLLNLSGKSAKFGRNMCFLSWIQPVSELVQFGIEGKKIVTDSRGLGA
jgi:hypothetical protein